MRRVIILINFVLIMVVLTGCSFGINGNDENFFKINITVTEASQDSIPLNNKMHVIASLNESLISKDSWFMFEIRSPEIDAPIWIPGKYEGSGVYSAVTSQLTGNYKLYGHFYASGGIHFTGKYSLPVS